MLAEELKQRQAPLKSAYREDPGSAVAELQASGTVCMETLTCLLNPVENQTADAPMRSGLHRMTGGDGSGLCSGDLLLQSLVACAGVTCAAVATAMSIPVRHAAVTAFGTLDFRGTLGVDREVAVGFQSVRLEFAITADAESEVLQKLIELTERYCVIAQTIRHSTPVDTVLQTD